MHSNREGIPVLFQAGSYYSRQIEWGDIDAGFWGFPAGFDSTLLFKGLPNGCECPHWGYLLKGRMRVKYADHEEVMTAGEAYYLAPGHLPVMEEDCEMVEFSPKDLSRNMMEIAGRNLASVEPGSSNPHCHVRLAPVHLNLRAVQKVVGRFSKPPNMSADKDVCPT